MAQIVQTTIEQNFNNYMQKVRDQYVGDERTLRDRTDAWANRSSNNVSAEGTPSHGYLARHRSKGGAVSAFSVERNQSDQK